MRLKRRFCFTRRPRQSALWRLNVKVWLRSVVRLASLLCSGSMLLASSGTGWVGLLYSLQADKDSHDMRRESLTLELKKINEELDLLRRKRDQKFEDIKNAEELQKKIEAEVETVNSKLWTLQEKLADARATHNQQKVSFLRFLCCGSLCFSRPLHGFLFPSGAPSFACRVILRTRFRPSKRRKKLFRSRWKRKRKFSPRSKRRVTH
mmetsp:Transcript_52230/g.102259  ORF Transcript_52230/g.102259 Transcript_52230/m.102259 type:complete len:207 (-) Transcript_52230:2337-2957(-)